MTDKLVPYAGHKPKGFAAMGKDRQRLIASKGGKSVRPEQRSFSKDPELAANAGRKGGQSKRHSP